MTFDTPDNNLSKNIIGKGKTKKKKNAGNQGLKIQTCYCHIRICCHDDYSRNRGHVTYPYLCPYCRICNRLT